jgi:hypothetical protein
MRKHIILLIVIATVIGTAIVASALRHYQLKAEVDRYRAELKAKGEPMDLAQVIPPPVPPDQNSAALFTNAVSLLATNWNVLGSNLPPAMRMVSPGKAMAGWQQPAVHEYLGGPINSWAEIDAALVDEKAGLDLLRQLPVQPVFDFGLNYSNGFENLKLYHLAAAKRAAQKLEASAASTLRGGDSEMAIKNILAMQSLVHGLSRDRLLISELVRIAIAQNAVASTWESLQSTNVTEVQLATLQRGWTDLEFLQPFENSMAMERVVGQIEAAWLRDSGLESRIDALNNLRIYGRKPTWFAGLKIKYKTTMWRYWWSYSDELRALNQFQDVIDASRQARTNHSYFAAEAELKKQNKMFAAKSDDVGSLWFLDPAKDDFHFIISSASGFEPAFAKVIKVEAARQLTVTAIALRRFQLKNGNYPEKLSQLTPDFLASVPLDPVDGQPLRYRREQDGWFLLYSIGEDGKDDGGDPRPVEGTQSFQWQHGRDWVWPQPATGAEIQKYYGAQAKK